MDIPRLNQRIRLKCRYDNEIRTVILSIDHKYNDLRERLKLDYGFEVALKYQDQEGDLITLASQNDLNDLLASGMEIVTVIVSEVLLPSVHQTASTSISAAPSAQRQSSSKHNQRVSTSRTDRMDRFPQIDPNMPQDTTRTIKWKQGEILGQGAFGVVYLGLNVESGELMAVKKMSLEEVSNRELSSLENEINLLRTLKHPNIVRYIGTEITPGSLAIFLEYVPGGSLKVLIDRFGKLDEAVVRSYTRQILLGLEYLHRNGIAHRDIKGANCLVGNIGVVKLSDFGASKQWRHTPTSGNSSGHDIRGTPLWMSPEVIQNQDKNVSWKKADVWSLGCTTIEMTTGKPPWAQFSNTVTVMYHLACQETLPEYPETQTVDLITFLNICLQRNPVNRPDITSLLLHPFVASTAGIGGWGSSSQVLIRPTTMSTAPMPEQNLWREDFRISLRTGNPERDQIRLRNSPIVAAAERVSPRPRAISNGGGNDEAISMNPEITMPVSAPTTSRARQCAAPSFDHSSVSSAVDNDDDTPRVHNLKSRQQRRTYDDAMPTSRSNRKDVDQYDNEILQLNINVLSSMDSMQLDTLSGHRSLSRSNSSSSSSLLSINESLVEEKRDPEKPPPLGRLETMSHAPISADASIGSGYQSTEESFEPDVSITLGSSTNVNVNFLGHDHSTDGGNYVVTDDVRDSGLVSKPRPKEVLPLPTLALDVLPLSRGTRPQLIHTPNSPLSPVIVRGSHKHVDELREKDSHLYPGKPSSHRMDKHELLDAQKDSILLGLASQSSWRSHPDSPALPRNASTSMVPIASSRELDDLDALSNCRLSSSMATKRSSNTKLPAQAEMGIIEGIQDYSPRLVRLGDCESIFPTPQRRDSAVVRTGNIARVPALRQDGLRLAQEETQSQRQNISRLENSSRRVPSAKVHPASRSVASSGGVGPNNTVATQMQAVQDRDRDKVTTTKESERASKIGLGQGRRAGAVQGDCEFGAVGPSSGPGPGPLLVIQPLRQPSSQGQSTLVSMQPSQGGLRSPHANLSIDLRSNLRSSGLAGKWKPKGMLDSPSNSGGISPTAFDQEALEVSGFGDTMDLKVLVGPASRSQSRAGSSLGMASRMTSSRRPDKQESQDFNECDEVDDMSIFDGAAPVCFEEHSAAITRFSAPRKSRGLLISSSLDGTIRIWGSARSESVAVLTGLQSDDSSALRRPDSKADGPGKSNPGVKFLTVWADDICENIWGGGSDGGVHVWSSGEGRPLRLLRGHEDGVTALSGLEAGAGTGTGGNMQNPSCLVASASADRSIRVWDLRLRRSQVLLFRGHTDAVISVHWGDYGREVVSASKDKTVRVWDSRSGRIRVVLEKHFSAVTSVKSIPDPALGGGRRGCTGESPAYVSSGRDSMLHMWSQNGECVATQAAHRGSVNCMSDVNTDVSFNCATQGTPVVLSGGSDGVVRLWDLKRLKLLSEIPSGLSNKVCWVGQSVLVGGANGNLRLWNYNAIQDNVIDNQSRDWTSQELVSHTNGCTNLICNEMLAASGSKTGQILRWSR